VNTIKIETAQEMFAAVSAALPADVAVFAAAVADWRVDQPNANKIKKQAGGSPTLGLVENPDILSAVAHDANIRPRLVIGFAAETEQHHRTCEGQAGAQRMRLDRRQRRFGDQRRDGRRSQYRASVTAQGVESWPPQSKEQVAHALVTRIADALAGAGQ
jgi:phosphopantothenoylcysteine decarboxylase/phosphopantothenate--cysteine ligase